MAAREQLSRSRVLAAAIEVADTDGLDAVTMRRVAAGLGVEAMSLYHHLPNKEALLDGLVDQVVAEIHDELGRTEVAAYDDWRDELRHRALTARRVMVRHRWAPALIGTRPTIPGSLWAYYDAVMETMIRGGLGYHLAHRALHALGPMVLGFVQELFSPTAAGGSTDTAAAEEDLTAMADAMPHLAAMVASEVHDAGDDVLGWCDSDTEFEFTLDLLLDGLERARVESHAGAAPPLRPRPEPVRRSSSRRRRAASGR